jgi:SnoaL-like domain
MFSRRYTIAIVDVRSGVERRTRVSRLGLVALAAAVALPVLIGIGMAWKASTEAHELSARTRALDIEIANYRSATVALARQIESRRFTTARLGAAPAEPSQVGPSPATLIAQSTPVRRVSPQPLAAHAQPKHGVVPEPRVVPAVAVPPGAEAGSRAVNVEPAAARGSSSVRPAEAEARTETAPPINPPRAESLPLPLSEGSPDPPDDEGTIRRVIAQYVNGLEARNLAAIKRVWPSMGGIQEQALRTEFQNARTVEALFDDPRITINDDTTTVTGLRSYNLVTRDGQQLSSVTRTTITLRRNGDGWVIEQVVHNQWRPRQPAS